MTVVEYWLIFVDSPGAPEINFYDNTSRCWFEPGTKTTSQNVSLFYIVQLSIWIVTCFSHRFVEARHKDYYQMYIHHIVTIGLMAGSWMFGYMRIGVLVLIIHDASDVPLDLMKMANYLKLEGPKSFFIVEIAFITCLISWAYGRLFIYPTKALFTAAFESIIEAREGITATAYQTMETSDFLDVAFNMPGWLSCNILLNVLFVLHIFWFYLLVKIAFKLVTGKKAHTAGEEEYEGQSTDEEA